MRSSKRSRRAVGVTGRNLTVARPVGVAVLTGMRAGGALLSSLARVSHFYDGSCAKKLWLAVKRISRVLGRVRD